MSRENESLIPEDLKLTHDGYFRETFKRKRLGRGFLSKVLAPETLDCLDLKRLTVEDRHEMDDRFKETIADVVYKVPIRGTKEHVNFFTVVEHKSESDFLTIFQLWGYVYLICRREFLAARDRGEVKAGYRLPSVVAIILHHGKSKFSGKTELFELFVPLPGLNDHLPKLKAILVDLNTIDDDDPMLNDPETPELRVVLMVMKAVLRKDVSQKIKDVLEALRPFSDDPAMRRLIRMTWVYLANNAKHLKNNFETLLRTFEEVVGGEAMPTMVEIWKAEGRAEGEANAEAKVLAEKAETVLTVLRARFKRVSKAIEDKVRKVKDKVVLDSLAAHAATCESLGDFEKHLP